MIIRDYRPEDYGGVITLWEEAGLPVKAAGRDARAALDRQINAGSAFILIAEAEGQIVGALLGSHDGRKGWLNRLAVAPAYRRAPVGVAVRLFAAAEERFRALGLEIFACLIEGENAASLRLFKRLGYERAADMAYLTKRLRPDV